MGLLTTISWGIPQQFPKTQKIIIENYRAIVGPLEIDLGRRSLLPVIGINESGKTTILQAIFAFDYFNDDFSEGRHLMDAANLYQIDQRPSKVSAVIEMTREEYVKVINEMLQKYKKDEKNEVEQEEDSEEDSDSDNDKEGEKTLATQLQELIEKSSAFQGKITLVRNIISRRYEALEKEFTVSEIEDEFAQAIIRYLPYILYFDDFRDSIQEKIEIIDKDRDDKSGWLAIVEQLFRQTDRGFSVFNLQALEERMRKTVLSKVNNQLNETLTREWQNFRLDDVDALKINITYEEVRIKTRTEKAAPASQTQSSEASSKNESVETVRPYLKFEVIERDTNGNEHFFYISNRSKGFYWFFNFVMKLEYNPKVVNDNDGAIYLLDEPGAYLHASAQRKLCAKLKQISESNKVLYCTHSHYLLDPNMIPLSDVRIAVKEETVGIKLVPVYDYEGSAIETRHAFQPILDALQVKPFILDQNCNKVILTEGIMDYYVLELFKPNNDINILPSVSADSMPYYISLLIAWRQTFSALWDNDNAGTEGRNKARKFFGAEIAAKCFFQLPLPPGRRRKRIMQDLFDGNDLRKIKETLNLPLNSSFDKTIAGWFYCNQREDVLSSISQTTKNNFADLFRLIAS